MNYLFDSDALYTAGSCLTPEDVVPMTLECYEVKLTGRNMIGGPRIQFKIKGHGDILYETSYPWALVLNDPENLMAVEHRNLLRHTRDEAALASAAAGKKVVIFE